MGWRPRLSLQWPLLKVPAVRTRLGSGRGQGNLHQGTGTRSSLRRAEPLFSCGGKPALGHPLMSASERNPEQGTVQGQGSQDTHSQSLLTPSGYLWASSIGSWGSTWAHSKRRKTLLGSLLGKNFKHGHPLTGLWFSS